MRRCLAFLVAVCGVVVVAITGPAAGAAGSDTGSITGTVTDSIGHAIAGVTVQVVAVQDSNSGQTVTAPDGSYTITLAPDTYSVCFDATGATGGSSTTGYVNQCWRNLPFPRSGYCACDNTPVAVAGGGVVSGISATLATAAAVSGTVTDTAGQPLAGVTVWADDQNQSIEPAPLSAKTASDGTYRVIGLPPSDQFTVCFDAASATGGTSLTGYLNQCDGNVPAQDFSGYLVPYANGRYFSVTAGSSTTRNGTLTAAGQINGTLTNASGVGIAGVIVQASGGGGTAAAVTDAEGHYLVSFNDPHAYPDPDDSGTRLPITAYQLYFNAYNAPGYVSETYKHVYTIGGSVFGTPTLVTPSAGTPTVVDWSLSAAATIGGTVSDPVTGAPVTNAILHLVPAGGYQWVYANTDSNGHYSYTGLPAGAYTLCLDGENSASTNSPAGYLDECYDHQPPYGGTPTTITVASGQTIDNIDLTPQRASRIAGTVKDTAGHGLFGQQITISQGSTTVETLQTQYDGTFTSGRLEPGTYTVCYSTNEFGPGVIQYMPQCFDNVAAGGTPTPVITAAGQITTANAVMIAKPDTTPPTVQIYSTNQTFETEGTVAVFYGGYDEGGSGIASYDVRYRVAAWNSTFGSYITPRSWRRTTSMSQTLPATPGHTYCFSVRARDAAGNVSGWNGDSCTALPVDDASMAANPTWLHTHDVTAYQGTLSRTSVPLSSLTLHGVNAKQLELLASVCSTCGRVAVYVNGHLLSTVSTRNAQTYAQVPFALPAVSVVNATVVIRAISGGPVYIDGLGVSAV